MTVWLVVAVLGVITMAIKAAGPVLLAGWTPSDRVRLVLMLVAPVVLAALVVVQVFTTGRHYQLDARVIGLAAAAVALLLRAPLLIVVVCAVAATALGRLVLA
jgi:branched-subunit amino acid transport protein